MKNEPVIRMNYTKPIVLGNCEVVEINQLAHSIRYVVTLPFMATEENVSEVHQAIHDSIVNMDRYLEQEWITETPANAKTWIHHIAVIQDPK